MSTSVRLALVTTACFLAAGAAHAGADKITVKISGFKFVPERITIKKDTIVVFVNEDSAPHTVNPDQGAHFKAISRLLKNESGTITFTTVGEQKYYCAIHPSMTGSVTVK